jgi:hypothetical protein
MSTLYLRIICTKFEIVQLICRRFKEYIYQRSFTLCSYFPLWIGIVLHLYNFESPYQEEYVMPTLIKFGAAVVEKLNVKFDRERERGGYRQADNGQMLIGKAHMSLQFSSAKNKITLYIIICLQQSGRQWQSTGVI